MFWLAGAKSTKVSCDAQEEIHKWTCVTPLLCLCVNACHQWYSAAFKLQNTESHEAEEDFLQKWRRLFCSSTEIVLFFLYTPMAFKSFEQKYLQEIKGEMNSFCVWCGLCFCLLGTSEELGTSVNNNNAYPWDQIRVSWCHRLEGRMLSTFSMMKFSGANRVLRNWWTRRKQVSICSLQTNLRQDRLRIKLYSIIQWKKNWVTGCLCIL